MKCIYIKSNKLLLFFDIFLTLSIRNKPDFHNLLQRGFDEKVRFPVYGTISIGSYSYFRYFPA